MDKQKVSIFVFVYCPRNTEHPPSENLSYTLMRP